MVMTVLLWDILSFFLISTYVRYPASDQQYPGAPLSSIVHTATGKSLSASDKPI